MGERKQRLEIGFKRQGLQTGDFFFLGGALGSGASRKETVREKEEWETVRNEAKKGADGKWRSEDIWKEEGKFRSEEGRTGHLGVEERARLSGRRGKKERLGKEKKKKKR